MAQYTKPEDLNVIWASDAVDIDIYRPEDTEIRIGWEKEKPPFQVENWSMRKLHQAAAYFNQVGIPEWDDDTEYQQNSSYVQGSDGFIYRAILTNKNKNPSGGINTDYWERFRGDRLATTTQTGVTQLATVEEVEAGVRDDVVVTPYSLGEGYTGNPAGTIITFAGQVSPDGYAECNGRSLSTSEYPELFAAIGYMYGGSGSTFRIPDLRGEFIRGWDHGRGADPGRAMGSYQGYGIQSHAHNGNTNHGGYHNHGASTHNAGNHRHRYTDSYFIERDSRLGGASGYHYVSSRRGCGDSDTDNNRIFYIWRWTEYGGNHSHGVSVGHGGNHYHSFTTNSTGGSETRPRNVAMMFCIKLG